MTSVSVGHIILIPIKPERATTAEIEPTILPTWSRELYRVSYTPPPVPPERKSFKKKKRFLIGYCVLHEEKPLIGINTECLFWHV